ncbi:zinc-binding dehydrogenase [Streptomyces sp. MBT53]|uniref:quinone oxidoreductase family protein n=1 Tax=Streptomyces sp. MBT53 TaxID=1488384 RepID=UPI001F300741|nr:zinc-binding dehydrogenase [Streptomyces sp. MBT53]
MRASAFKETGGPEVLRLVDLPDPEPGPGEILIRVAYAGVNYGEIQHRLGDFGQPAGETVPGLEASGRVTALGEGVTEVSIGDTVTAYLPNGGGYAEYAVAPAVFAFPPAGDLGRPLPVGLDLPLPATSTLPPTDGLDGRVGDSGGVRGGFAPGVGGPDRLPDGLDGRVGDSGGLQGGFVPRAGGLDLRTAGGAALVLTTAYGVLVGAARVAPGDTVLVHAAAGGVGGVAAQLARALGAGQVYGTVSTPEKAEYARRSFGYDEVFVREGFPEAVLAATSGRGVDIVLDPVGGPTRLASFEILAPFGRLAVYGEAARHPDLQLPVLPIWKHNRTLTGYNIGDLARRDPATVRAHALSALALAASGAVRIDVTEEYGLADAAEAHRVLGEGRNRGKVVLAVGDPA